MTSRWVEDTCEMLIDVYVQEGKLLELWDLLELGGRYPDFVYVDDTAQWRWIFRCAANLRDRTLGGPDAYVVSEPLEPRDLQPLSKFFVDKGMTAEALVCLLTMAQEHSWMETDVTPERMSKELVYLANTVAERYKGEAPSPVINLIAFSFGEAGRCAELLHIAGMWLLRGHVVAARHVLGYAAGFIELMKLAEQQSTEGDYAAAHLTLAVLMGALEESD